MLNVFIIDQRPLRRLGIRYILENNFEDINVADFNSVQESKSDGTPKVTDLIFLGIEEGAENLIYIDELKSSYPHSRVIVYNQDGKSEHGIGYLRSGAHGYLSKRSDLNTLRDCVKAVSNRKFYIDPTDIDTLLGELASGNKRYKSVEPAQVFSLTPRQREIAQLYAEGMSTSGIAKKLGLQSSTVSTVKSNIYGKLKVNNVIGLKEVMDLKK